MNSKTAMAQLRRARLVSLLLFALLLAWGGWAAYSRPYMQTSRTNSSPANGPTDIQQPPRRPLSEYIAVARQREMFRQSVIYETRETAVVDVLGDLAFLGVVRGSGKVRAFIQNTKTGQSTLYSEGQSIGDITIQEIHDDRIVVVHGSETLELAR